MQLPRLCLGLGPVQVTRQPLFNSSFNQRKWFHKHGKQNNLCLSDQVMVKLREYFNALDPNKCEYIAPELIEEPLILFGLCENQAEVQSIVKMIDTNGSGVIQFDEFVQIFKIAKKKKEGKEKFMEFANMITGDVQKQLENKVCIRTSLSQYRRKMLINFLKRKNSNIMKEGKRIAKHIAIKSERLDLLPPLRRFY